MAALTAIGIPEALARERVAAQYDSAESPRGSAADGSAFAVLRENWRVVQLWCAVESQWIIKPMGGVIGLDHSRLEATLRLMGVRRKRWPRLFAGIKAMERAALEVMG